MDPETDGDGAINLSTHQQPEPRPILVDPNFASQDVSFLYIFLISKKKKKKKKKKRHRGDVMTGDINASVSGGNLSGILLDSP